MNKKREDRRTVKVRPLVHDTVQPHRLILQDDIIAGQNDQIDVAEPIFSKLRQDVELSAAKAVPVGQDRLIEIAFGMSPS